MKETCIISNVERSVNVLLLRVLLHPLMLQKVLQVQIQGVVSLGMRSRSRQLLLSESPVRRVHLYLLHNLIHAIHKDQLICPLRVQCCLCPWLSDDLCHQN